MDSAGKLPIILGPVQEVNDKIHLLLIFHEEN